MQDKTIEILLKLNDQMTSALDNSTRAMLDAATSSDKLTNTVDKETEANRRNEQALKSSNREHEKQRGLLSEIGDGLTSGIAGWVASTVAIGSVVTALKYSVQAYDESIQTEKELERALGFTSTSIIKQAESLQTLTRFEDDATKRAAAHLAVYTQEESEIMTLIPLIQDFATAKGMDLVGASELVAKSIFGEVNMLGRYGISLGEADTASEKLAAATEELNQKFKGAAQIAGQEGAGGIIRMKNAVGDLAEVIGGSLIPTLDFWAEKIGGIAKDWQEFLSDSQVVVNDQAKAVQQLTDAEMRLAGTVKTIERLENQRNTVYKDSQSTLDDRLKFLSDEKSALENSVNAYNIQIKGLAKLAKAQEEANKAKKSAKPKEISEEDRKAMETAQKAANESYAKLLNERALIGLSEQEQEIELREQYWDSLIAIDAAGGSKHLAELRKMKQYEIDVLRSGLPSGGTTMDISGIYSPSAGTSYTNGMNTGGDAAASSSAQAQENAAKAISAKQAEAQQLNEVARMANLTAMELENEQYEQKKAMLIEHKVSIQEIEKQHEEAVLKIKEESLAKEQEIMQARLAASSQFFGGLGAALSVFAQEDKSMRVAAKAAMITQAIIDTYAAANKALAVYGPTPWGYAAAAGAVGYGFANVANIKAHKYATGTNSPSAAFGVVPGTNYTGDKVPVMVNSGEEILTRQESKARREGSGGNTYYVTYAPVYSTDTPDYKRAQDQLNFSRTMRGVNSDPANKRLQPSLS